MKLLAIVGTNADFSFNRLLCQFIAKRFGGIQIAYMPCMKDIETAVGEDDFLTGLA